jgi:hypothetical protein
MKNIKISTIFIGSVFLLSGVGISYAAWFDTLEIQGVVNTGNVSWEIVDHHGTWIYKNLMTEECIESESPIESTEMLLIAYAKPVNGEDEFDVKIVFDNLFPNIWFRAGVIIKYTGSIPGKINKIDYNFTSENNWIDNMLSNEEFYIEIKDTYENFLDVGSQLHSDDEILIDFNMYIPQENNLMNISGNFSVSFEIIQWNEFTAQEDESDGESLNISNFVLYQTSSEISYTLPEVCIVEPGGYVIIARDSDKTNFEDFWNVTLSDNVVFIDSDNVFPSINGDETFELHDNNGEVVDGPSGLTMESYHTIQRIQTTLDPTLPDSWTIYPDINADPGQGANGDGTAALIINEYSDASGTGNWRYEFIELFYDA